MEENRTHPRFSIKNMSVDISDGRGFFAGAVGDISRFGLCMKLVSKKLRAKGIYFSIVASKNGKYFQMTVVPCWNCISGYTQDIGVRIIQSPPEWEQYIDELK